MDYERKNFEFYSRFFGEEDLGRRVGWLKPDSQRLNFLELSQIIPEPVSHRAISVLDVGCGTGELWSFLSVIQPLTNYLGVDILQENIMVAKEKYPLAEFIRGDALAEDFKLPTMDFVFASGLFGLRLLEDDNEQMRWVQQSVSKLFKSCRLGVAVNFWAGIDPARKLFSYNPYEVCEALRLISHSFILNHDFRDDAFSIFLYKEKLRLNLLA